MIDYSKVSLTNQVFEKLERMILHGTYPQGSILVPENVAADLSVGMATIREALAKLEIEKLIAETPQGIKVIGVTMDDINDMYMIKKEIEIIATGRAAEKISEDGIVQLRSALDEQEKSVFRGDAEKARNFDTKFHDIIYAECGSKTFEMILSPIHHKLAKYRMISINTGGRGEVSLEEHRAVFEAIAAHDIEQAEKLMLRHIENAYNAILALAERK